MVVSYLRYALGYGLDSKCAFWNRAGEQKAWGYYADSLQSRIFSFDDTLGRQKALGDQDIVQNQMSCFEMAVRVDEDLGLQDLIQTCLVYKVEVGHSSVWVCKAINKDKRIIY